jgi:hypothetical protein
MAGSSGKGGAAGSSGAGGSSGKGGSAGAGGAAGASGSAGKGGSSGTAGTGSGSGPCSGLCEDPIVFSTQSYASGNLGTQATCHQTTASLQGFNCSNLGMRTLSVNDMEFPNCEGMNQTPPPKRMNGYCIQVTAGTPEFMSFSTF